MSTKKSTRRSNGRDPMSMLLDQMREKAKKKMESILGEIDDCIMLIEADSLSISFDKKIDAMSRLKKLNKDLESIETEQGE